jgi:hypothetical protein
LIIFIPAIVAVAVFSGVTLLLGNLPDVLAVLPQGLSYVLVPAIGFLSFYWRQRWRLSYGLFEVMIGVYTPIRAIGGAEFKYLNLTPLDYLQIIGGIYVIVRGLDNVGVGLRGTPLEPFWSSVFSPKKKALE